MPDAVIYVRLSHDHQDAADTLDRQESDGRARAASEKLTVRQVYNEGAGRSAFGARGRHRRPVFDSMLRDLTPGDVVIARNVDRLARDAERGLEALRLIRERGAYVLTLWDGVDTRRDASSLNAGVRLLLAEEESAEKSRRIRSKQESRRARGFLTTGSPPWGMAVVVDHEPRPGRRGSFIVEPGAPDLGRLRPCPSWGALAREMALSALVRSTAEIAQDIHAHGVPTTYGAVQWSGQAVRAWLRSPALAGLQPYKGKPLRHPETGELVSIGQGIVSLPEWEAITAAREARSTVDRSGRRRGAGPPGRGLLSGIVVCAHCERSMAINRRQNLPDNYRCATGRNHVAPCPGCGISARPLEAWVRTKLLGHARSLLGILDRGPDADDDPDPVAVMLLSELSERWVSETAPEVGHRRRELEAELAGVAAALDRLAEAHYVEQDLPRPTYVKLRDRQEERRAAIQAELAGLRTGKPDLGPLRVLADSPDITDDLFRELLVILVERIEVLKAPRRRPAVEERVRIVWAMDTIVEAAIGP